MLVMEWVFTEQRVANQPFSFTRTERYAGNRGMNVSRSSKFIFFFVFYLIRGV